MLEPTWDVPWHGWYYSLHILQTNPFCSHTVVLDELFAVTQVVIALLACVGLLTDALLSFDKAIECAPGPRSAPRLYNRAYLLRRMGRLQEAATGFKAAMDLDVNEAPRCSAAIADIEAQVQERGAASDKHAPELTPSSVVEPATQAGGLYLCSCDHLQPKWRDVSSSAYIAAVGGAV